VVPGHRIDHERFQLSHVAWKAVGLQQLMERGWHGRHILAELVCRLLDEMIDKNRNVALSAAQRRQMHMVGAQPIVEILAEASGTDGLHHIGIGRHHDARPALAWPVGSEWIEAAVLQEPQQLDLRSDRQIADLVQEDGAGGSPGDQAFSRAIWPNSVSERPSNATPR
jgi:hypothetical protein